MVVLPRPTLAEASHEANAVLEALIACFRLASLLSRLAKLLLVFLLEAVAIVCRVSVAAGACCPRLWFALPRTLWHVLLEVR